MLDREMIDSYVIIVKVMDGGKLFCYGFILVMVNVIDINDNFFVFNSSLVIVVIFEVLFVFIFVIKIIVIDLDFGSNVEIFYSIILGNGMLVFVIFLNIGIIIINMKFDRENILNYVFICWVIDCGNSFLYFMLFIVYVIVLDVNDNVFIFD